ncbi:MAG: LysR family transcriptional regulator [Geobacteraceae bacterium]|nr:LysR family transcriptional regulator [Geobacteraceae bacterium]
MDIRRLEIFCAVVDQGSFTRAADTVFISQPSVSENIRILEQQLGEKLVDRLGCQAHPTHAGKILYKYARKMIQIQNDAKQAISSYQGNLAGLLRVGASTVPGAYLLPELLQSFKRQYPQAQLQLLISGSARIVDDVLTGTLELGLVGSKPKDQRLGHEEVCRDELQLVVHPQHPFASRGIIDPEELLDAPFVMREYGSGTRAEMSAALKGVDVDTGQLCVVADVGSNEAVREAVKSGIGVSVLSALAVREDIGRNKLAAVAIKGVKMPRSFYLIHRSGRQQSPLAAVFNEHVLEELSI